MKANTVTGKKRALKRRGGFTLMELIIVIALIGILATLVLPQMRKTPNRAREAVLQADLHTLRDLIDQYFADRGHYPEDLNELVSKGYLRSIPRDPFTKSSTSWKPVYSDEAGQEDDISGDDVRGIYDIHSSSTAIGQNGTAYSEW
jgi:general secretion pathway protein G